MAILALFSGQGYTKNMYETLRREVDWEHRHPPGGMFHASSFEKSGSNIHVADVWETEDQLNNFVSTRLTPVMQKYNMPLPKMEVYEIHNINAFPTIEKYKVK